MPEILAPAPNGDRVNNNVNGDVSGKPGLADLVNNNKSVNGNGVPKPQQGPHGPTAGGSDWIDAALVAEALGEDPASVRDIVVKAAVADGDNYCSCMWRVRAVVGDRPVALIVKAPPRGELMQDFVSKLSFFSKEERMLTIPGVLIMEDLSVAGYRNKERQGQLDQLHCETALEILARLHALSVALHREQPGCMDAYAETLFARRDDPEEERHAKLHSEGQLKKFGEMAGQWEATAGTGLGEKMVKLSDGMHQRLCDIVAPGDESAGSLNVLNHGDFWINNMMFLYDEDDTQSRTPTDIRVVDLQIVRFSSPALDLQYFIVTSANQEVREGRLDELLEHYRRRFNEYAAALGLEDVQWPTLDALRDEFLAKSLFGFSAIYTVLCAVVAAPEDKLQLEGVTKDNMMEADISSRAWRGSNFQRLLPGLLEYFDQVGVLE
ncbi:hypothetical protein ONE63_000414 [Megalurothrips usitatus]|uniref:CHK kinase-like domain-containing protein n=1 Tax=Megalurothrips usitatus TaxID=439358 RepID=A0AAV7Y5H3_9NEOP|nr:hypothetical protein ONE63_000414 [Megalurothrips usitatus]